MLAIIVEYGWWKNKHYNQTEQIYEPCMYSGILLFIKCSSHLYYDKLGIIHRVSNSLVGTGLFPSSAFKEDDKY